MDREVFAKEIRYKQWSLKELVAGEELHFEDTHFLKHCTTYLTYVHGINVIAILRWTQLKLSDEINSPKSQS